MEATAPHPTRHLIADEPSEEQVLEATSVFAMLADPTRMRILWALRDGAELDVTTLAERALAGPTTASQHLMKLRMAGLVATRREGRHIYYRAKGGHVRRLLAEALFHTDHELSGEPHHD